MAIIIYLDLRLAYINTRPSSYNISSPLSISQYILITNILASTTLMADFNFVADLKSFKTMWRMRVSIFRLWKQYSAPGGLTIEMVLIDSNVSFYNLLNVECNIKFFLINFNLFCFLIFCFFHILLVNFLSYVLSYIL